MKWYLTYLFGLSAGVLLFTCGLLIIDDQRWEEREFSRQQNNADDRRPLSRLLSGGSPSFRYQINIIQDMEMDTHPPSLKLGDFDYSNAPDMRQLLLVDNNLKPYDNLKTDGGEKSIIRQIFGPPRSKPTAVLIADHVGNFEPESYPNNRTGPGENGAPVYPPNSDIKVDCKSAKSDMQIEEVSKLIAMNRTVPDSRPQGCKYWHYDTDLPMASVVVPFYNTDFHILMRTVHSIKNTSPARYLKEIILVDIYSNREELKGKLENYLKENFGSLVKLHRTTTHVGLIKARTIGAKLATGEAVVFLTDKCECNRNWLVPLLARIAYDPTIVVSPVPDGIDSDTFAYITYQNNEDQGSFDWGLNDVLGKAPEKYLKGRKHHSEPFWSPIVGYVMAFNKEFFFSLGAFDPGLEMWGGDLYELSFKVWQCGGSVEMVPCSHVANMWPRNLPYDIRYQSRKLPEFQVNLMRVAEVWMDPEYLKYFYIRNPDIRGYPTGDLTDQFALKKRLQCKSFKYFLDKIGSGVLEKSPPAPKNVAWGEVVWKDGTTDICWQRTESIESDSAQCNVIQKLTLAKCNNFRTIHLFRFNARGELAVDNQCVVKAGENLGLIYCPFQQRAPMTGDFQYEPTTRFIRHIPTNMCAEGEEIGKELRLRSCNEKEIKQKWKFREFYPKK